VRRGQHGVIESDHNSRWWGGSVGVVTDPNFFDLSVSEARRVLEHYEWVEFKSDTRDPMRVPDLARHGFAMVDIQIRFRVRFPLTWRTMPEAATSVEESNVHDLPSSSGAHLPFANERFRHLERASMEHINRRYRTWMNDLCLGFPTTCLTVSSNGKQQGWFLSVPSGRESLHLTLAVLASEAVISGLDMYGVALEYYQRQGYKLGHAEFSATNTSVLSIYSALGARFVGSSYQWLWQKGA
jgi:hypothetical protein